MPYCDESVDFVAVPDGAEPLVREAWRVAQQAVLTLKRPQAQHEPSLHVQWKSNGSRRTGPSVSIVIPTFNNAGRVEACLSSLEDTLPADFQGEILLVDDASPKGARDRLRERAAHSARVKILRNRRNAGFLRSCNRAAQAASGQLLVFLNDDTLPLPDWLAPLTDLFRHCKLAGAVGGQLLYPDGRLQEAGGLVFSDGSAANVGRGDWDPDAPLYNFVRQVDYCSAALLATPRSLFLQLGGFDTRYCPAYYEDTDYCFALRARGYRVYYQPASKVIHFEGASCGLDVSGGVKRYQAANRLKFVSKWEEQLRRQPAAPDRFDRSAWHALASEGAAVGGAGDG